MGFGLLFGCGEEAGKPMKNMKPAPPGEAQNVDIPLKGGKKKPMPPDDAPPYPPPPAEKGKGK
jgi:hypothetical protein